MNETIAIAVPLIVGYMVALVVYMALTFVLAKVGRSALSVRDKPKAGFYLASAMAWLFATFAGCYCVAVYSVFVPKIASAVLAAVFLFILVRNAREFHEQQTRTVVVGSAIAIVLGEALVWYVTS